VLVIAIVVMASMVVVFRGKNQQPTVLNVSNLNNLEASNYIRFNNTIWQDPLNDTSPWHVDYSQPNMTSRVSVDGVIRLNATIASESYPQAISLYRSVNFSLAKNPVLLVSLEASVGIHYGIRIAGQDSSGIPFQAWSESSYLQHRSGLGRIENFTINSIVEAYNVNGIFSAPGSRITSLLFYIEATPGQTGQFALDVYGLRVVAPSQYPFNAASQVQDTMDEITLTVNYTDNQGFTDSQFAQGYIDYYVKGSPDLDYTVYFMHGLTIVGQGFEYSARSLTYNIATFSASKVTNYPPLLVDNNTFEIVLSPLRGSFLSFQLGGFSIRYLRQAPSTTAPTEIDPTTILSYYLIFLFVTPVAIVILVSKVLSNENNQTS
jgi:hypothetical protein